MAEQYLLLVRPLHCTIRQEHRNAPIKNLPSSASCRVEDCSLECAGKRVQTVARDGISDDALLMERAWVSPFAFHKSFGASCQRGQVSALVVLTYLNGSFASFRPGPPWPLPPPMLIRSGGLAYEMLIANCSARVQCPC